MRSSAVALILTFSLGVSSVHAQETIHASGDPVCDECRIEVEPVVTIGSLDGPGFLSGTPNALAVDSRGRYFVKTIGASHEVKVYTSNGTLLQRIGREGQGPGEFLSIQSILVGSQDSVFVFDGRNGRVTIYDQDLNLVRQFPFPDIEYTPVVELPDGHLIVNATIRSPEIIGLPLQLIDRAGAILRSFGAENPVYRGDSPVVQVREISSSRSGGVWSAPKTAYVLPLLNPERRLV